MLERTCGVLLHLTSLPGPHGVGTLGPEAYAFADRLAEAGMSYWQILPLGPVDGGLGYSPYASPSTFAGNWHLVSPETISREPWFSGALPAPGPDEAFVRFDDVVRARLPFLERACRDFFANAAGERRDDFDRFCAESSYWLDDWSLYAALAERHGTGEWLAWDGRLALREPAALAAARRTLEERIRYYAFVQYLFFRQWAAWKLYCSTKGIKIIGDIPIYISLNGADAWAHPEVLALDPDTGRPDLVAGVPPDYFSETGQRWGNPLYRWFDRKQLHAPTMDWWTQRIKHLNWLVDIIRIDHFRGFESYWAIPAAEKTAVKGSWLQGPGMAFFDTLRERLGDLPLIAEDLGIITPEVEALRDGLGLPGMKILQFAFDFNNRNTYLPHNLENPHCVLYTGTHDNNTTNGWFYGSEIDDNTRHYVLEYLGLEDWSDFHWKLIRQAYRTTARLVVIPAQDILGYGEEFRMNRPGTARGNWGWKLTRDALAPAMITKLRDLARLYGRLPLVPEEPPVPAGS